MKDIIILPTFKDMDIENENAQKIIEDNFKGIRVETIQSDEIAAKGGILNCISWNILAD